MLKSLEGIGQRLEIHSDGVVIKRTDVLATLLPGGFSDEETVLFSDMISVHLHQPEKLRLDDCKTGCLQLVMTRADHTHASLILNADQADDAQTVRRHLEAQIGLAER